MSQPAERQLPPLPRRFHNAFLRVRTKFEIEYANQGRGSPVVTRQGLTLNVFYAYCDRARKAVRAGDWTAPEALELTEAAWQPIFERYYVRDYPGCSEHQKLAA